MLLFCFIGKTNGIIAGALPSSMHMAGASAPFTRNEKKWKDTVTVSHIYMRASPFPHKKNSNIPIHFPYERGREAAMCIHE